MHDDSDFRSDIDVSNFIKENDVKVDEVKKLSMASWDIDNFLKQTHDPHPQSVFESHDLEQQKGKVEP